MDRKKVLDEFDAIVNDIVECQNKLVELANRIAKLRLEIYRNWNE